MDSIIVFPPGPSVAGSQLQIGTYLMADPGANYGAQGMLQSLKSSNALNDGGRFGFRWAPVRQMAIPLLLRDVPGQTLLQTESLLREWSTPGAAVAIQPESIPSGQAVFFDVLDGRWEPDYDTFENRAGRRKGTLFLDTQPFGYWPTEMLLASAASIGAFGQLAVNGASLLGDVPPLAHLIVAATSASQFQNSPAGSGWAADMLGVSFAAKPSFLPFIGASAMSSVGQIAAIVPSQLFDKYSPASMARQFFFQDNLSWVMLCDTATAIPSTLEPAYRGRFRVFAYARSNPSAAPSSFLIVDADRYSPSLVGGRQALTQVSMASANQLATVYNFLPSAVSGGGISPSPNYSILDMGEITLPPQASGYQGGVRLRCWGAAASGQTISIGGLYLLPAEGAGGILARGLYTPTIWGGFQGVADFNSGFQESINILQPMGATYMMSADGRVGWHGAPPRIGASTTQLTLLVGDRNVGAFVTGATYPVTRGGPEYAQVSVSYRPTFQFLAGL